MQRLLWLVVFLSPIVTFACGDSGNGPVSGGTAAETGGAASNGMVVPNTFLTFEGRQYRLAGTLQANLVDEKAFTRVGSTQQADTAFEGDLEVYRRAGDGSSVFTFSRAVGEGERSVPALWLRWAPAR